jgi:hypothetical protein
MSTTERELLEQLKILLPELRDNTEMLVSALPEKMPRRVYEKEVAQTNALIKDIEACLAKPVQEPVGTVRQTNGCTYVEWNHAPPESGTVCYAAPQSREQPPLVQIASDIMGACMNGDLSAKWEDVADLIVANNFDGLSKLTQSRKPMSDDEILEAIARGWCHAKNEHKTMDIDLVSAIASEVYHAIKAHHGIK